MSSPSSNRPEATSTASTQKPPSARTNMLQTSPNLSPAGAFRNPSPVRTNVTSQKQKQNGFHRTQRSQALTSSLLRRLVPHLLLHLPLPARLPVQHQRNFPTRIDHWLSVRRLHHLMLISPLRGPI